MGILKSIFNKKKESSLIKLTYTDEMKEQDALWEKENEDVQVMERLYKEIIKEAREKGFKGYEVIYEYNGECVCEIYENVEQYNDNDNDSDFMAGYCKPLIEYLEAVLNHKEELNN